jgi:hypothetical protein
MIITVKSMRETNQTAEVACEKLTDHLSPLISGINKTVQKRYLRMFPSWVDEVEHKSIKSFCSSAGIRILHFQHDDIPYTGKIGSCKNKWYIVNEHTTS